MSKVGWLARSSLPIFVMLFALALVPPAGAWGSSVHHDQAITIGNALEETTTIPANIREQLDGDLIYSLSLAPDDWRDVTGEWGTWHYNMAENGHQEFMMIREAWANNDNDNAIARIGVVLHFIGDVMYMPHNEGIREWYENCIPPLGSAEPLWDSSITGGESGKYFSEKEYFHATHYANQQAEAYTDSDSAWYPHRPENYGLTDDGSLDWFLDSYLMGPTTLTSDIDTSGYDPAYVIPRYIRMCNPYDDPITGVYDEKLDNRWLYWVSTRDPAIAKQDADNTIRLTYNGVYRAIRDGERARLGNPANFDTEIWPWPTTSQYLSLNDNLYIEGMDLVRWYNGQSIYGSAEGGSGQGVSSQPSQALPLVVLAVGSALVITMYVGWRRSHGNGKQSF